MSVTQLVRTIGDRDSEFHRSSLWGNSAIYDGINDYDYSANFQNVLDFNQPFTMLQAYWLPNLTPYWRFIASTSTTNYPSFFMRGWDFCRIISSLQLQFFAVGSRYYVPNLRYQGFTTAERVKIGYNLVTMHFEGGVNNVAGMEVYINGKKTTKTGIVASNLPTDVLNPQNGIEIGIFASQYVPQHHFNGKIRKIQLINRAMTNSEHRRAFNNGTLEGIVPDSDFLLDVDFDKTSGPLTTRVGTPSATFTAFGGRGYAPF